MPAWEVNKDRQKTSMLEIDPVLRTTTFEEVACGYNGRRAVAEARRCIQCKDAPCVAGCPVGVPIPSFVACLAQGDLAGAYATVKMSNALPAVCGRVCPQETQCEGVCTRGRSGEPVAIGRLERFTAAWARAHKEEAAQALAESEASGGQAAASPDGSDSGAGAVAKGAAPASASAAVHPTASAIGFDARGARVAVIGSGPAGLTCASELAKRGVRVTVFEALHAAGGVLTYGIPEFRLPKAIVANEVDELRAAGVQFKLNAMVGRMVDVRELMDQQGFDAVFVATGAGLPSYLGVEGEGLNGVMTANELLTRVNLMHAYEFPRAATPVFMGEKCVVVGGGNVAMDCARTAVRLGARTTVVYRRGRDEMPAREEEIRHAEQEGIRFFYQTNPVRMFAGTDQWVSAVECVRMELGDPDESGRRAPHAVPRSEFVIRADSVVIAIGARPNPIIAQTTPGLQVTPRNLILADEATGATSVAGVFAGGDVTTGAATVILAMGAGKRAAAGILEYLSTAK